VSNKDTTSKPSAEERGSVLQPSEAERKLAAQIRAHISWANTEDRTQRTANARAAFEQRFLDAAGGDPVKAAHLRKAFYLDIARKSAKARRKPGSDGDGNVAA
jgi:hypothetical protein